MDFNPRNPMAERILGRISEVPEVLLSISVGCLESNPSQVLKKEEAYLPNFSHMERLHSKGLFQFQTANDYSSVVGIVQPFS